MLKDILKDYKVEKQVIKNMEKIDNKYLIENELSEDEKLDFIDLITDGYGSYMYNLMEKFEKDKEKLPTNDYGQILTVSLKAWIKRNDILGREKEIETSGSVDAWFNYGSYNMISPNEKGYRLGSYSRMSTITPTSRNGFDLVWTGHNIINQWFNELLNDLRKREIDYFRKNDEFTIKINELKEINKNIYLDIPELNDVINRYPHKIGENMDIARVQEYIDAYNKIQLYIKQVEKELEGEK